MLVVKAEICNNASDFCKGLNVYDAVMWISCAWDKINASTIEKCFISAGFKFNNSNVSAIEESKSSPEIKETMLLEYSGNLDISIDIITGFITFDNNENTHESEDIDEESLINIVIENYRNSNNKETIFSDNDNDIVSKNQTTVMIHFIPQNDKFKFEKWDISEFEIKLNYTFVLIFTERFSIQYQLNKGIIN